MTALVQQWNSVMSQSAVGGCLHINLPVHQLTVASEPVCLTSQSQLLSYTGMGLKWGPQVHCGSNCLGSIVHRRPALQTMLCMM